MNLVAVSIFLLFSLVTASSPDLETEWSSFKQKHSKTYSNATHEAQRKQIFNATLNKINKHNQEHAQGLHTFTQSVNEFSDLTQDEFNQQMKGAIVQNVPIHAGESSEERARRQASFLNGPIPSYVNWTAQGYVTPVKNQNPCGSCWTFSATGALEGQIFKKTGNLTSLSEQEILDCTKTGSFVDYKDQVQPMPKNTIMSYSLKANGCNGGSPYSGFIYYKYNGLVGESQYPYTKQKGACQVNANYTYLTSATAPGFVYVYPQNNETVLAAAIANVGPISVLIDASDPAFSSYSGGIYSWANCSSTTTDHAVLAVGYGTDPTTGQDFYIVNWGVSWGENGFFRLARNQGNKCGIASTPTYPLV